MDSFSLILQRRGKEGFRASSARLEDFLERFEDLLFTFGEFSMGFADEEHRVIFQETIAAEKDKSTPEVLEFIRLTLFAGASEWESQISLLDTVATLIEEHPSLSLPSDVISTIEWAFNGAEDMFDDPPLSGGRILRSRNIESRDELDSRIRQLEEQRERIERAAIRLTDDPGAASAIRLHEEIQRAVGGGEVSNLLRQMQQNVDRLNRRRLY
ncbi:hypothetical protein [Rhodococcus jostii]|uniref:hypothetical protein n=1 Tax=Rhodococcus jostii TaxID=132919 RepID=UPI00365D9480